MRGALLVSLIALVTGCGGGAAGDLAAPVDAATPEDCAGAAAVVPDGGDLSAGLVWMRRDGMPSAWAAGTGVATDRAGNVFVVGHSDACVDGITCTPAVSDYFLTSWDAAGNHRWTAEAATVQDCSNLGVTYWATIGARAVATDAAGNVFLTGDTGLALAPAEGNKKAGSTDIFVASYDPTGHERWTRQLGGPTIMEHAAGNGVATDGAGNVYVTGFTEGVLDGKPRTVAAGGAAFLLSYDGAGNLRWLRQLSASGSGLGVATDGAGNVVVVGWAVGSIGDPAAGVNGSFVASFDGDGNLRWVRGPGGASVATDRAGNIYVAGTTSGELANRNPCSVSDAFLVSYDSAGNQRWLRQPGSPRWSTGDGVATDGSGNVFLVGRSGVGPDGEVVEGGPAAFFLMKFDSVGSRAWTRLPGPNVSGFASGVATEGAGGVYVAGGRDSYFLAKFTANP